VSASRHKECDERVRRDTARRGNQQALGPEPRPARLATHRVSRRRRCSPDKMKIFAGVHYYLSPSLDEETSTQLGVLLDQHGAAPKDALDGATHVITNSKLFEGWQDAPKDAAVVTVSSLYNMPFTNADSLFPVILGRAVCRSRQDATVREAGHLNFSCCTQGWSRTELYSAEPGKIFSGVVACAADVCSLLRPPSTHLTACHSSRPPTLRSCPARSVP
jgi:hypothetical protein